MSERLAYAIDEGRWPLVMVRATEHINEPEAAEASYRKLERILMRRLPFMLVFDMRGATSTPSRRRRFLEWCGQNEAALTRLIVAGAVVAASSIERGFVTATLWVRTPPWPMKVFATSEAAEAWLRASFSHLVAPPER